MPEQSDFKSTFLAEKEAGCGQKSNAPAAAPAWSVRKLAVSDVEVFIVDCVIVLTISANGLPTVQQSSSATTNGSKHMQ